MFKTLFFVCLVGLSFFSTPSVASDEVNPQGKRRASFALDTLAEAAVSIQSSEKRPKSTGQFFTTEAINFQQWASLEKQLEQQLSTVSTDESGFIRLEYAKCLYMQCKWAEAENHYVFAFTYAKGRESFFDRFIFANSLYQQGKWGQAEFAYKTALDQAKGAETWIIRANYSMSLMHQDKAVAAEQQLIKVIALADGHATKEIEDYLALMRSHKLKASQPL